MIKVKDFKNLFSKIEADITFALDDSATKLRNYSADFVSNGYRKECESFWPLRDPSGEIMPDPATGEPFGDEYRPEQLAYMLKSTITRSELKRIVRVWVDLEGQKGAKTYENVGNLMEVFGCRPWGRVKTRFMTANGIADIIK